MNKTGQNKKIIQRMIVFSSRGQTETVVFIVFCATETYIRLSMHMVLRICGSHKNKDF